MNDFIVSDTDLEAEWIKDKVFTRLYYCSNCKESHRIEHTTRLTAFCGRCGARMKNPQTIIVEYDYGV